MKQSRLIAWWRVIGVAGLLPFRPARVMDVLDPWPLPADQARASWWSAFVTHLVYAGLTAAIASALLIYMEQPYPASWARFVQDLPEWKEVTEALAEIEVQFYFLALMFALI